MAAGAKAEPAVQLWSITQFVCDYKAADDSTHIDRTEVCTGRTGFEFEELGKAGAALIFGRGVETLTFTLHGQVLPHISPQKQRGSSCSMQRGDT